MKRLFNCGIAFLVALSFAATGCEGDVGPAGANGTNGDNGNDGNDGADGAQGPEGPQGQPGLGSLPLAIQLPTEDFYPEGIAVGDNALYVGSITSGQIIRAPFSPNGTLRAQPLIDAGQFDNGAIGMIEVAGNLWVCDADPFMGEQSKLINFDISDPLNASKVASFDFQVPAGGQGFCNDVAVDPDGNIYATDSFGGRIVRVAAADTDADGNVEEWLKDDLLAGNEMNPFGANGIVYHEGVLVVVNFSKGTVVLVPIDDADGSAGTPISVALTNAKDEAVTLQGPDGVKVLDAANDVLILVEGGGSGALTKVSLSELDTAAPKGAVEVIASRLDVPTTVAVDLNEGAAYVVEGQLDHLFTPDDVGPPQLPFGVVRVDLFGFGIGVGPLAE